MVNDSFIKKKSYYEDIFDLLTIEEALRIKNDSPSSDNSYSDKFPTETIKAMRTTVNELLLFFYLGERVKKKKLYLERVMSEDKEKQQFYDSKFEPNHVLCPYCESPVHLIDKTLDDFSSSQMQVIFMYECIGCKKRSCFFPDGKLKTFPPDECSNCKSNDILEKSVQTPRKTTITSKCNSCGHISETIYDLDELEQSRAEREKYKNSLFMSYRLDMIQFISNKIHTNHKEYEMVAKDFLSKGIFNKSEYKLSLKPLFNLSSSEITSALNRINQEMDESAEQFYKDNKKDDYEL